MRAGHFARRCAGALLPPTDPIDLAVFRITVFAVILASKDVYQAVPFASLPADLRTPPAGLSWLAAHVPVSETSALGALAVLSASSALALVGFKSRASALVATVSGLYLLGVPQLYGTVRHYHHLIWFAALLAASPCGDALSVDAWLRARAGVARPEPSPVYAIPIRTAWVLIGFIYFFPGVWKLAESGSAWAFSDNLVQQMRWKWLQYGRVPSVRIDRQVTLCRLLAAATVAFELSFVFLIWFRRLRRALVGAAILFHVATDWLMYISFSPLWLCYTVFFRWSRRSVVTGGVSVLPRSTSVAVAALLIAGNACSGWRARVDSWPFACYPTFQWIAPDEMPDLEVDVVGADGRERAVDGQAELAGVDSQRRWGLVWSLLAAQRPEALAAYFEQLAARDPTARESAEVRFYRVQRSTDPAEWQAPPRRRELIYVLRARVDRGATLEGVGAVPRALSLCAFRAKIR